jgi:hypothetical protein
VAFDDLTEHFRVRDVDAAQMALARAVLFLDRVQYCDA